VANFSIISRRVADAINGMGEAVRFYGGFLTWTGFAKAYVDVTHVRRRGESGYTFLKLMRLATNIILRTRTSAATVRVRWPAALRARLRGRLGSHRARGSARLARDGMDQLDRVGLVQYGCHHFAWDPGLYIDRIFTEVKHRPLYVVRKTTFDD